MKKPKYRVLTLDPETNKYTPQKGIRSGPYTLMGLRKVYRKLRGMAYGYSRRDMFAVLIERID